MSEFLVSATLGPRPLLEGDIRKAVHELIALGPEPDLVVNEMGLSGHKGRVDVATWTEAESVGYEIKGTNDSLGRLKKQVPVYGAIFDRMVLVADSKFFPKVLRTVPAWWQVVEALIEEDECELHEHRTGSKNPSLEADWVMDDDQKESLSKMFWRQEMIDLLVDFGVPVSKVRTLNLYRLRAMVGERYTGLEIAGFVRAAVIKRKGKYKDPDTRVGSC